MVTCLALPGSPTRASQAYGTVNNFDTANEARQSKELERENAKLKKMLAEEMPRTGCVLHL